MRRGLRNNDKKPKRHRSSADKLGERRRERLMTRSCCFMSRLSATTALAPPGPRSLAIVVNKRARSTSRSFMAEQGRGGYVLEQDCLSCLSQVTIMNSPATRSGRTISSEISRAGLRGRREWVASIFATTGLRLIKLASVNANRRSDP